ncbi:carbonic anhydrase [Infundibulicybe gibba]|nr:carbonic anhydrase [Infundibulicybe gibba]
MTLPAMQRLADGNNTFRARTEAQYPGFFKQSAEGQSPPFFYLGCADSRLSEGTLTGADSGTLFAQRNIANQFREGDVNTHPALAYGVATLGVSHILVVGHYGCRGVGAAMSAPPSPPLDAGSQSVQDWIFPIRELYEMSTRAEIVQLRNQNQGVTHVDMHDLHNPGFRALVEENVKANVRHIAIDPILTNISLEFDWTS